MLKFKKPGFTLAEVLAAMLIIGIIAILVLPSLNKRIDNKARMTLLKNTVSSISNVVQKEMTSAHTDDITLTDIYNDPEAFLTKFDIAPSGEPFASSYKSYNGDEAKVTIPSDVVEQKDDDEDKETKVSYSQKQVKVMLKNGVGLGIINGLYNKRATAVIIDVNGNDKPNIAGVDYFIVEIYWDSDETNGVHSGDIGAYINGGDDGDETTAGIKTSCKGGNGAACYRLVELSGFNPEYLN